MPKNAAAEHECPAGARELYVSINTVNTHIPNISSKLGVPDRFSAVKRARELRLLSTARR
jgi:LuxR family transcriptional regulator, maltose regulon positive regulatory protein